MLERLYIQVPEKSVKKERMEIPKPETVIQGRKTLVKNFSQFAKTIDRPEKHILKFVTKETAASATVAGGKLTINGKFPYLQIEKMFDSYVKTYVLCPECKRPDTKVTDQQGIKLMKCEACGAVSAIRKV
jgi:translation initiation factor 2 subunit 2